MIGEKLKPSGATMVFFADCVVMIFKETLVKVQNNLSGALHILCKVSLLSFNSEKLLHLIPVQSHMQEQS